METNRFFLRASAGHCCPLLPIAAGIAVQYRLQLQVGPPSFLATEDNEWQCAAMDGNGQQRLAMGGNGGALGGNGGALGGNGGAMGGNGGSNGRQWFAMDSSCYPEQTKDVSMKTQLRTGPA